MDERRHGEKGLCKVIVRPFFPDSLLKNLSSHKLLQKGAAVAWEDNVVVADRVGEEVSGGRGVVEADDLLGAAEVGLGLVTYQFTLADEMTA